jgi:hypothetical protein
VAAGEDARAGEDAVAGADAVGAAGDADGGADVGVEVKAGAVRSGAWPASAS